MPADAIDCDVHCAPASMDVLLPYLDDYWRSYIDDATIRLADQAYPANVPTTRGPAPAQVAKPTANRGHWANSARGRQDLTDIKRWAADSTNTAGFAGTMVGALAGADVYIGLSGGTVPEAAIASMAENCIVFSLANPTPEVDPEMAARYAAVVATGRSDLPNQINNVLAFPGVFRGAIDAGARSITEEMKLAAAVAIADVVGDDLAPGYIVPSPLDRRVATAVAEAVAACAREQGA